MQQRPRVQRRERAVGRVRQPGDAAREQAAQARADDVKRQVKHAAEQPRHRGVGRVPPREYAVDARAAPAARQRLRQGEKPHQPVHLRKARRGQRLVAPEPALAHHARRRLFGRRRCAQGAAVVEPLRCREHRRQPRRACRRGEQPRQCPHAGLHRPRRQRTPRVGRRAVRCLRGRVQQRVEPLAQRRAHRHDRNAQRPRQPRRVHRPAACAQRVHHVQRQHDRHAQLQQLQRQVQAARRARRVRDADDRVRRAAEQIAARDALLVRVRPQRVHARQVHERDLRPRAAHALASRDGHAREVARARVCPREGVEKRRFAAVGVAREREDHGRASFFRIAQPMRRQKAVDLYTRGMVK